MTSAADDSAPDVPTHEQFVRTALTHAGAQLLGNFPYTRGRPICVAADSGRPVVPWFAAEMARQMSERGLLVRDSCSGDLTGDDGTWRVLYHFDRYELRLSDPQRRAFLGRIWVRRTLDLNLAASAWDVDSGELLWVNAVDSTWEDWVPRREVDALGDRSSQFLSPAIPTTGLDRSTEPLVFGGGAVVIGILFLIVR